MSLTNFTAWLIIFIVPYSVFSSLAYLTILSLKFTVTGLPILIIAYIKSKIINFNKSKKFRTCKKILTLLCILVINLTLLSGCYDARGIEDLAYVTALGFDIDDNNILSLTFQILLIFLYQQLPLVLMHKSFHYQMILTLLSH